MNFQVPFEELILNQLAINSYEILSLELSHVFQLAKLPLIHKDPFDRIMIAQAFTENISIVSIDPHFQNYPVSVIW